MSYLIALYVYYHGNNLAVFGITKGARDEDLNNRGTNRPEEIKCFGGGSVGQYGCANDLW